MSVRDIESVDDLRSLVLDLFGGIDAERQARMEENRRLGRPLPSRIGFDVLTFPDRIEDLLAVQKAIHWNRGYYRLTSDERRKARLVGFAGVCQFIKDEYDGVFWDGYRRRIGLGPDIRIYDAIWAPTFREEGAELIRSPYRREFVQSFVQEAGIPRRRHQDTIDFFLLYWRYLRKKADPEDLISDLLKGAVQLSHVPAQDRYRITSLVDTAKDYPVPFARVLRLLARVFNFIERDPQVLGCAPHELPEAIRRGTGIDPLTILHDAAQLQSLLAAVAGRVTPAKLMRILQSKPPGHSIRIPSGEMRRVEDYAELMYGEHEISGVCFMCVPSLAYGLDDLVSLDEDLLTRHGNAVLLRSYSTISLDLNGWDRSDLVRPLYRNGQALGYLLYVEIRPGTVASLATDNGTVDETISGGDGTAGSMALRYFWNSRRQRHLLVASMSAFSIKAQASAKARLALACDTWEQPFARFRTDEAGFGMTAGRRVLRNPNPGELMVRLVNEDSGEAVFCDAKPVSFRLPLASVMLFSVSQRYELKPLTTAEIFRYGGSEFGLFVAEDVPGESVDLTNWNATVSRYGGYRVYNIRWKDRGAPTRIHVATPDGCYDWAFERCQDFALTVRKTQRAQVDRLRLKSDQATSMSELQLVLDPAPDAKATDALQWVVVANDVPGQVRLADAPCGNTSADGKLILNSTDLARIIGLAGHGSLCEAARVDVALTDSTRDVALASTRFWVLPQVRLTHPACFDEGEDVAGDLQIDVGGRRYPVQFTNAEGQTSAGLFLSAEADGAVHLTSVEYLGKAQISELGTDLVCVLHPRVNGVRLLNARSSRLEAVRNLSKSEIAAFSLILVDHNSTAVTVMVNGHPVESPATSDQDGLHIVRLAGIPDLHERENSVQVVSGRVTTALNISYVPSIKAAKISGHLVEGHIVGIVSYEGPRGAGIVFSATDEDGQDVGIWTGVCDGRTHENVLVRIHPAIRSSAYILEAAVLSDVTMPREGIPYGTRWRIATEQAAEPDDATLLESAAQAAYQQGHHFRAISLMNMACDIQGSVSAAQRLLLNDAQACILRSSLNSLLRQSLQALRRGGYVDV